MTLSVLAYGVVLGLLLALTAHFLEDAFRKLGGAGRWLWMGAMAGSALLPLVFLLAPATAPWRRRRVPSPSSGWGPRPWS